MAENVRSDEIYLDFDQLLAKTRGRMDALLAQRQRFVNGGLDAQRAADMLCRSLKRAASKLDDSACETGGQCSNSPSIIEEAIDVAAKALLIVFYDERERDEGSEPEQLDLGGVK